jgi:hypothetical protein
MVDLLVKNGCEKLNTAFFVPKGQDIQEQVSDCDNKNKVI